VARHGLAPARLREVMAQVDDLEPSRDPAVDADRRQLADRDRKLARHRAALEAGADPLMVTEWMSEIRR
jgi:site-specific DNA recombinase